MENPARSFMRATALMLIAVVSGVNGARGQELFARTIRVLRLEMERPGSPSEQDRKRSVALMRRKMRPVRGPKEPPTLLLR